MREVNITYRPGKANPNADALSRSACDPAPDTGITEDEFQVAVIDSDDSHVPEVSVDALLQANPDGSESSQCSLEEHRTRIQC